MGFEAARKHRAVSKEKITCSGTRPGPVQMTSEILFPDNAQNQFCTSIIQFASAPIANDGSGPTAASKLYG